MVVCLYKSSSVLILLICHYQKATKKQQVGIPGDVLSAAVSPADWWFYVDMNIVMYELYQYIIRETHKHI